MKRSLPFDGQHPSSTHSTARQRPSQRWVRDLLQMAIVDQYREWEAECMEVAAAYTRWTAAPPGVRASAHAAYRTALDREERASRICRDLLREARAHCSDVSGGIAQSPSAKPDDAPAAHLRSR